MSTASATDAASAMQNPLVAAALAELTPPSFDEIMEALEAHEEEAARLKKMVKAYAKSKGDKKTRAGSFPKGSTPTQVKRWNAFVQHIRVQSGVKLGEDGKPVLVKDKDTGEMKETYNMTLQEALSEASRLKTENPSIVDETLGPVPAEEAAASAVADKAAKAAAKAAAAAAEKAAKAAEKAAEREAAKAAKAEASAILKAEKAAEKAAASAVAKAAKAAEREAAKAEKAAERELAKAAKAEAAALLKASKAGEKEASKADKAAAAAAEREAKKAAAAEARELLKAQKLAEKSAAKAAKVSTAAATKKPAAAPAPAPADAEEEEEDDLTAFNFKGVAYWRDAAGFCWLNSGGGLGPYAGKYDAVADKINAKIKEPAVKSA